MHRRNFLAAAGGALAAATPRPNVLMIMTDQQSAEAMSCRIGRRYLHTPNLDRLAASGMSFTRAYTANPLCVPARTALFSGHYPCQTGIETNDKVPLDLQRFPSLALPFARAGYDTAFFGKWHMPYPQAKPDVTGFAQVRTDKANHDAGAAAAAAEFIRVKRTQPFLLMTSFLNPHNICQWPRGEALSEGAVGALPALSECPPLRPNSAVPKDETDTMLLLRRSYQATKMFPVSNLTGTQWREYIWAYYRMIEKVDALIGQVLDTLRETGQERNTVVAFLADHGDCQGAHKFNQKTVFYEESVRVPFVLSQPGTIRPGSDPRLVNASVDLFPTLFDYTGVAAPAGLPGLSLKGNATRDCVVVCNKMVQGAPIDGRLPVPDGRMLRSERYKYCVYSEGAHRESLVDLDRDPGETVNLARDPAHSKTLAAHRALLHDFGRRTADPFQPLIPN